MVSSSPNSSPRGVSQQEGQSSDGSAGEAEAAASSACSAKQQEKHDVVVLLSEADLSRETLPLLPHQPPIVPVHLPTRGAHKIKFDTSKYAHAGV